MLRHFVCLALSGALVCLASCRLVDDDGAVPQVADAAGCGIEVVSLEKRSSGRELVTTLKNTSSQPVNVLLAYDFYSDGVRVDYIDQNIEDVQVDVTSRQTIFVPRPYECVEVRLSARTARGQDLCQPVVVSTSFDCD